VIVNLSPVAGDNGPAITAALTSLTQAGGGQLNLAAGQYNIGTSTSSAPGLEIDNLHDVTISGTGATLMMMQWVEETDRKDPLIPLHKDYKAFNFYHLPDNRVVGLWKNALTGISKDEGKTWSPVVRAPHFVNSNAKIWGQHTSDGKYATVYNPSEFRWPLAISTSEDGLNYTNLSLVQGEISTARYGGNYKSYGPQYTRGIEEGNGNPPDGNC